MCAILDANVVSEVFGDGKSPAGERFRKWLDEGHSHLVAGGKLADELAHNGGFRAWRDVAIQYGRFRLVDREQVEEKTAELRDSNVCASDDEHVVALAQVSGARLLFSNDAELHKDFKSKELIVQPRGKVYSTKETRDFTNTHKRLLADQSLCREQ